MVRCCFAAGRNRDSVRGKRLAILENNTDWVPRPCRVLCDRAGFLNFVRFETLNETRLKSPPSFAKNAKEGRGTRR